MRRVDLEAHQPARSDPMSVATPPLGVDAPWLGNCDQFARSACSADQASFFETMGIEMGFTDFRPATVNWAVPTPWRGAGGCARRCFRHSPNLHAR